MCAKYPELNVFVEAGMYQFIFDIDGMKKLFNLAIITLFQVSVIKKPIKAVRFLVVLRDNFNQFCYPINCILHTGVKSAKVLKCYVPT